MPKREITVYPITGRQLFFRVPHSWCEECDLTIRTARRVAEQVGDVEVTVKPWFNHLFDVLRRGGVHAPVLTIAGEMFSQGIVPAQGARARAFAAGVDGRTRADGQAARSRSRGREAQNGRGRDALKARYRWMTPRGRGRATFRSSPAAS